MDLRTWLKTPGPDGKRRTVLALAKRAKTTRHVIYKVISGHVPRAETAKRISAATGGAVSVEELLGLKRKRAA